jgi:hypothetical protein
MLVFIDCREAKHQQEQRTAQMKRLLQKDVLIKAAANCYTWGRFTYPQVTPCVMHARPSHNVYCMRPLL